MKKTCAAVLKSTLLFSVISLAASPGLQAHEVKSLAGGKGAVSVSHNHVRAATGYGGTYRTGHQAKTGAGDIIIWSAAQYNGYGASATRNRHYRGGFNGRRPNYGRGNNRNYGARPNVRDR